jgi:hypothetical protein
MGAVLQQRVENTWQPLTFFSKKLNPAHQKYNTYNREHGHLRGREAFSPHAGRVPLHFISKLS